MSIFRTRRSLKPLEMDPTREISREVLLEIIEDAHWAPTHGLTQPWRFHAFASPSARQRLADRLQTLYDELVPAQKRDAAKRTKLGAAPRNAPVVIALTAEVVPNGKIPAWEEVAAVSCAAQNLMLSAHTRGIGSFWSSPPAACSAEFVRWLGLDAERHRAMGLIYLGYALPGSAAPQSRRVPLAERLHWQE